MTFGQPLKWAYLDGEFVTADEARCSVLANALSYGTGTFEGIRAYWNGSEGQLYLLDAAKHYQRMHRSARILGLPLDSSVDKLVAATAELLRRNEARADTYLRPLLFLAEECLFVRMHDIAARLVIAATPMPDGYLSADGLRCMTSTWRRAPDNVLPSRAKVIGGYAGPALAKTEAMRAGYDEAILLTVDGFVAEATTANILLRDDRGWFGPAHTDDILAGVTLDQVVILLREEHGEPVEYRRVHRSELYTAAEMLLCGTAATVTPVVEVDGRRVGDGRPGRRSVELRAELHAIARRERARHSDWTVPVYV